MRRALETELIRSLPQSSLELVSELKKFNAAMATAAEEGDVLAMRGLNREFHFAIFAASGFDLVVRELERVWPMSDAYRSVYLFDASARERIVEEHDGLIEALRVNDLDRVVELMDAHRSRVPLELGTFVASTPLT